MNADDRAALRALAEMSIDYAADFFNARMTLALEGREILSVLSDLDAAEAERDAAVALLRECRTIMAEMDEGWPALLARIEAALAAEGEQG